LRWCDNDLVDATAGQIRCIGTFAVLERVHVVVDLAPVAGGEIVGQVRNGCWSVDEGVFQCGALSFKRIDPGQDRLWRGR